MKKNTTGSASLIKSVLVILLLAFLSTASAQVTIQLEVNDAEDKLIITTPGSCKKEPNPPGCVSATRGASHLNFNFVRNKTCSATGKNWALDSVVLKMTENGPAGNLSPRVAKDFDADPASGYVNPRTIKANHIAIQNLNSAEYEVWYEVTAYCIDGTDTINTDPRVENDGTGSN